ncbi:MAG: nucleoside triphosphate pyrophosphohydrolase [Christensenellales bacterium]|jgi:tetrapyrrole methylase family protein/MazG family protein
MKVIIAALGEGGIDGVSLGAYRQIKENYTIFRTEMNEAASDLLGEGVRGETLDSLYESAEDFESLCGEIAAAVLGAARERGSVVYAVPGGAGIGDATVAAVIALCRQEGAQVSFACGTSPLEMAALEAGGLESAVICSGYSLLESDINTKLALIVTELDGELLAGDVKLKLMDYYHDETPIIFMDGEISRKIPLRELDRQKRYSYTCKIVINPIDFTALSRYDFIRLLDLVAILRGQGDDRFDPCPWDMEQTHESLRADIIEEAYEFADAIDSGDPDKMADELGDVLLQVAMHSQIAGEYGEFNAMDVTTGICKKMISRHRHIFGAEKAKDAASVLALWDDIKKEEKHIATVAEAMRDVPRSFPALMRAAKVLKRAANAGFDWPDIGSCMAKVSEEMGEIKAEIASGDSKKLFEEVGDMLLAAAKIPRVLGIDGELALSRAVDKFIKRFDAMERAVAESGREIRDIGLQELEAIWAGEKRR